MTMKTQPWLIRVLILSMGATLLTGCGGIEGGGVSDAPFLIPDAWPLIEDGEVRVRAPADGSEDLLLRLVADDREGNIVEQGAVYRFFLDDERFEMVDPSEWDEADGPIAEPGVGGSPSSADFETGPLEGGFQRLFFGEALVTLAGGNFLDFVSLDLFPVVVVRSTAGRRPQGSLIPFFPPFPASERRDQNYHQILSTHDGSRIGPIVRIPVRGQSDRVVLGPNERYMVYYAESKEDVDPMDYPPPRRVSLVSVVPLKETLEWFFPPNVSDVPVFQPTEWRDDPGSILIRPLVEGSDELLITTMLAKDRPLDCGVGNVRCPDQVGQVYKFDPAGEDFEVIEDALWFGSFAAASDCGTLADNRTSAFAISTTTPETLLFDNREVELAGNTPIAVLPALRSTVTAILSKDGDRVPGGSGGQYFHQIFSESTGQPLTEPLRLPRNRIGEPLDQLGCWSRDERYVVYSITTTVRGRVPVDRVDLVAVAPGYAPFADDCDRDGILDGDELAAGAEDCNDNGLPDECDEFFVWFLDDFEEDRGWTVGADGDDARTGIWTRAEPDGAAGAPLVDHSPFEKDKCFVTAVRGLCDSTSNCDVDDGTTTLISPAYDLTEIPTPSIRYWRWYYNDSEFKDDALVVEVSADDGLTWTNVETVGPTDEEGLGIRGGWTEYAFLVSDVVEPSATVRVRFIASDTGEPSLVEAAVDDFAITSPVCPN